jgi:hypothetical protein
MASPLIPRLKRLKIFTAKLIERLGEDNKWQPLPDESDLPLEQQVNAWLAANFIELADPVAPPNVALYRQADDKQLLVMTLALTYYPTVEHVNDPAA